MNLGYCPRQPWQFHSFNERLLIVSCTGKGEMKGESKPLPLKLGNYVLLPGRGIHQFTAVTNVELFLLSNGPFDIHYVDPARAAIPRPRSSSPKRILRKAQENRPLA